MTMETASAPNPRSSLEVFTEILFLAVVLAGGALTAYGVHQTGKWDVYALIQNFYVQIGVIFSLAAVITLIFFLKSENRKNFLITALLISALFHLSLIVWSGTYNLGRNLSLEDETLISRRAEIVPPRVVKEYLWVPESGEVKKSVYDEELQEKEVAPELEEKPVELEPEPEFHPDETLEKRETEAQKMARDIQFQEHAREETLRETRELEKKQERNLLKNTTQLPAAEPKTSEAEKMRLSPEASRAVSRQMEIQRVDLRNARLQEKQLENKGIQEAPENFHSTVARSEQALSAQQRSMVVADDARLKQKSEVQRELSAASVAPSRQPRTLPGVGEAEDAAGMADSPLTRQAPRAALPVGVAATRTQTPVLGGGSDGTRAQRRKVDREEGEIQVNASRRTGTPSHSMVELAEVPRNAHGGADQLAASTAVIFRENAGRGREMSGPESSVDMTFSHAPSPAPLGDEGGTAEETELAALRPVVPADSLLGGRLPSARFTPTPYEPYRQRTRANHRRKILEAGGDPASEETVEYGLAFLGKTQFPDGRWAFDRLPPGTGMNFNAAELGQMNADTGATGLALLAFLGAGYTHIPPENATDTHHETVLRGLEWLMQNQQADGSLFRPDSDLYRNARIYSHGIATIALCEACGMTQNSATKTLTVQDRRLKLAAQRAVDFIIDAQTTKLGAWRYTPEPGQPWRGEGDTSVSGWMLMALVSAKMAGLQVPDETIQRVQKWMETAAVEGGARFVYLPMQDPKTEEQRMWTTPSPAMTAEGMLMRLYLRPFVRKAPGEDEAHAQGLEYLTKYAPRVDMNNLRDTYYWYYATQVMFHAKGEYWKNWQDQITKGLMSTQSLEGATRGSWSPTGPATDRWGHVGGRHYITAMHLLILEVYYRHLPLYGELAK